MNTSGHELWVDQLSAYLDGDLDAAGRERLEAHLEGCLSCRGVLADLRTLVVRARSMGEVPPTRDLWPGIARALDARERPDEPEVKVYPLPGTAPNARRRGLWVTLPQAVAASVVLVAASAALTGWLRPAGTGGLAEGSAAVADLPARLVGGESAPIPAELAEEVAGLEQVFARARDRMDPNTVRIVEKNLGVIQRAIDESVQALAVDPANAFLRQHLERTYREKASFLRDMAAFADWEG